MRRENVDDEEENGEIHESDGIYRNAIEGEEKGEEGRGYVVLESGEVVSEIEGICLVVLIQTSVLCV
jgi:hypothetical protein